ncbi:MAG: hypothetical protein JRN06_06245 [Nitrososphaerota archaeon]|nr:hypothetical protein [Nitrososphaerota archaeon]
MKKSKLYALLIASLFISSSFIVIGILPGVAKASGSGVVAVDYYHQIVGNQTIYRAYGIPPEYSDQQADMSNMWGNLTKAGYTVNTQLLNQTTPITSSELSGVSVLFIGQLSSLSLNYTASEVAAIKGWFQTGGKLLMVSGNSDYAYGNATADNSWQEKVPNMLMSAIGSSLRLDYGEVTDQPGVGAAGAGFRVYANAANPGSINTQGWAATLTNGTTRVRFHGTTNVIGYLNGKYVPFDQLPTDTIAWLYKTSPQGSQTAQGAVSTLVTPSNTPGQWVLAAAEKIPEGGTYSKVVLAGAGFIGAYIIAAASEFGQNITYNGLQFVINAVNWGTTAESVPSNTNLYLTIAAVAVVAIIVIAAGLYMMRRKPKATSAPAS